MIKNNKLILALEFSGHQIATVSVSVNKPLLVDHFDDHLGKHRTYFLSVYLHFF